MICDARGGGGGVVSEVSVLCGAGGGLTVHPLSTSAGTEISAPSVRQARRDRVGTLLRVSTRRRRAGRPADKGRDATVELRGIIGVGQIARLRATVDVTPAYRGGTTNGARCLRGKWRGRYGQGWMPRRHALPAPQTRNGIARRSRSVSRWAMANALEPVRTVWRCPDDGTPIGWSDGHPGRPGSARRGARSFAG